jgi:pilus assembly protein Flp/PilA
MKQIYTHIAAFMQDEEGASAIEYALIAALIAAVIVASVKTLGVDLRTTFEGISADLKK